MATTKRRWIYYNFDLYFPGFSSDLVIRVACKDGNKHVETNTSFSTQFNRFLSVVMSQIILLWVSGEGNRQSAELLLILAAGVQSQ